MKTLILLLLMTQVCWGDNPKCENKNIVPSFECGHNARQYYDGCYWQCGTYIVEGEYEHEFKQITDHVDRLAVALIQLAKLQQEKYEQQQYQLDTLSQTVMESGKK